jgi:hypothetical protein
VTPARWVASGTVTRDLPGANLVALPSGDALLIGIEAVEHGDETSNRMATEVWDHTTEDWHQTAALERLRSSFASVALADGRVLVTGGFNERDASYSSAYVFDPPSRSWAKTGPLFDVDIPPVGRALATAELFDPATGTWTKNRLHALCADRPGSGDARGRTRARGRLHRRQRAS